LDCIETDPRNLCNQSETLGNENDNTVAKKPNIVVILYQGTLSRSSTNEAYRKLYPTYERGWNILRAERLQRMKQLGLVDESFPCQTLAPSIGPISPKEIEAFKVIISYNRKYS
jgi:hypothetical protein